MTKYIIIRHIETYDYWSNDDGWTEYRELATRFDQRERDTLNLPTEGAWRVTE